MDMNEKLDKNEKIDTFIIHIQKAKEKTRAAESESWSHSDF